MSLVRLKALTPTLSGTSFEAFRYREYRYFWLAAAFSNIGMWTLVYGRLWLMRTLTDSELLLGLVATASLGPVLFLSMWGGVLADRVNRLYLVRFTRLMFAAVTLLTAVLIATDVIRPWHVIAISAGTGVLLSFDIPSRSAMVATIVPRRHLAGAIAMYSIVFGAASIIGPALFAPLVLLWGLEGLFFIIAASYLLTVLTLMLMNPKGHKMVSDGSGMWSGLIDGLTYVRRSPAILGILGLGVFTGVFGGSFETLMPVFADEVFSGAERTYGNLLLAGGIGGLTGTIIIALIGKRVRPAMFLVAAGISYGFGLVLFARFDILVIAMLILGVVGSLRVVFGIMNTTLMQTLVEEQYRGRVMSLHQFTWGATALGGLLMGGLAQNFGAPLALTVGGFATAIATAVVGATVLRRMLGKHVPGASRAAAAD